MRLTYPRILLISIIAVGILIGLIYTINLAFYYANNPIIISELTADYTVEFTASRGTILNNGECVTFSWDAVQVAAIYFEGDGRIGPDSSERCPRFRDLPDAYVLGIEHADGTQSTYEIIITRAIPRFINIFVFILFFLVGLLITYFVVQQNMDWFFIERQKNTSLWLRYSAYMLILLTPITVPVLLLWVFHGATINDVMPVINDDTYYWHQAASYIKAGFNSGYYAVDEIPADADFSPFYAWGAGVPILYGSIGQVFGWSLQAIPMINLTLLTFAIVIFLIIVRPNLQQTLLLWLLLATFTLTYIFSIRSMLPLLHQALALVIASFFIILLRKGQNAPIWAKMGLGIMIASAVAVRPTYGILWFPYLLLIFLRLPFVFSLIGSVVFLGAGLRLQSWWSSYHPFHTALLMEELANGKVAAAFERAWSLILRNIYYLIDMDIDPIYSAHRLAVFLVIAISIAFVILHMRQNHGKLHTDDAQIRGGLFAIYSMVVIYALITVVFHLRLSNLNELRNITPFFLMVMAILIVVVRNRYIRLAIIPFVFIFPLTINLFYEFSARAVIPENAERYETMTVAFGSVMLWQSDVPNRWCNTILLEHTAYLIDIPMLTSIDPGLGLSWIEQEKLPSVDRFRSAYVMLTDEIAPDVLPGKNLEPIANVPAGKLYRNWDSDCDIITED